MTSPAFTFNREDILNLSHTIATVTIPPITVALEQLQSGTTNIRNILIALAVGILLEIIRQYGQWPSVEHVKKTATVIETIVPQSTPIIEEVAPIVESQILSV